MRKAALLALPLAVSGCSGIGKYFHDTLFWPGSNPNSPLGDSENMRRSRGEVVTAEPILPEHGNMWPGSPQPLPTLRDVENPNSTFNRALGDPATYFGGAALDKTFMGGIAGSGALGASGAQMKQGQSISIGETSDIKNGVGHEKNASIPSFPAGISDNASRYLSKPGSKVIVIPNGDGTSTLISPDGSVRVVKGTPTPK